MGRRGMGRRDGWGGEMDGKEIDGEEERDGEEKRDGEESYGTVCTHHVCLLTPPHPLC